MSATTLPRVAALVDEELTALSKEIDWLTFLSPTGNDQMWETFKESGYREAPELHYREIPFDIASMRRRLLDIPVQQVELPLLAGLMEEKQLELERHLELIRLRNSEGMRFISIGLWGDAEPSLRALAHRVLDAVPVEEPEPCDAGCEEVVAVAESHLEHYRQQSDDFDAAVVVDPDLNSLLMVSRGDLHIAKSIEVPRRRVEPLVAHEVGAHIITYHNGSRQPLNQLSTGLAHYEALQEGLGVLAEYLAGYLSSERLRQLALRVVAADLSLRAESLPDIFACLHEEYRLPPHPAFDVAVRALRGGGMTKDAIYLRGLNELLMYLQHGGSIQDLYVGKLALEHLRYLDELRDLGLIRPADILPRHLVDPAAQERLRRLFDEDVTTLFQPVETET